jgi:alanyl-tRNA synthetase
LVDFQKCIRTGDIDSVGDFSHLTFFEMLGNWSLGDYFKEDAIRMSYEFLTSPQWLNIPPERLGVTVFAGEKGANGSPDIPRDEESARIWRSLGFSDDRSAFRPREDNWWGPAGETGPCGPDSEMFIDMGANPCGPNCAPGCGCGKWLEIWNDVFMEYIKDKNCAYLPLARKCVDTGMGVERTVTILSNKKTVYDTDIFAPIIAAIEAASTDYHYGSNPDNDHSCRIIADHARAAAFILGDPKAVTPSNLGAGYVLRRLIRRAVRHGRKLNLAAGWLPNLATVIVDEFKGPYPELEHARQFIIDEINKEVDKFSITLDKGEREFETLLPNLLKDPKKIMSGRLAFKLYDTYGFPIELTEELAAEHNLTVNRAEFDAAFAKHQEISRTDGGEFKGGLADHSEITTKYHTATHLLQKALQIVLGPHVAQKGSNITHERMRFDFSQPRPMTSDEVKRVETIVNEQIARDLPVTMEVMSLEEAKAAGAMALFGEKYESQVKVYTVGDFSKEVCGGPHVERTGLLGHFRIVKEQSSSSGVRRIRAVLE